MNNNRRESAAAGRPNQRQILAGADVQVYMTQHLVVVVRVFKAHIAELNAAFLPPAAVWRRGRQ